MRAKRGIARDIDREGKHLKKGQSTFWRIVDIMLYLWKHTRLELVISTIHDTTNVNTGRKDRKRNIGNKRA